MIVEFIMDSTNLKAILKQLRLPESLFEDINSSNTLKYYCKLIGQTLRRSNYLPTLLSSSAQTIKPLAFSLLKQFVYNHTPVVYKDIVAYNDLKLSPEVVDEQILHKWPLEKIGAQGKVVANPLCLLDSVLALSFPVVFVEGNQELEAML